ncbi:MAG TPA: hypothetical protein VJ227_03445 [Patescibacteria group bacterium]|nr:hypothetical protein [Patescibacteria group bacterium]
MEIEKDFLAHWDEFRLLFSGGKLSKRDGWRNVVRHQVTVFFGVRILGEMMDLSVEDQAKLGKAALVHDWEKRLHLHPEEFRSDEIDRAHKLFEQVQPDKKLMFATSPDFLERVLYSEVSMLELLQFYLDACTLETDIVSLERRADDTSVRRADLDGDTVLTQRLGGKKYWDLEREVGRAVENIIFDHLVKKGIPINDPRDIPGLIRSKMDEGVNNV